MPTTIKKKHEAVVGKRIRRKEDPRLLTGTATYVEDIELPNMHYASILRSPYPAAKIKNLDLETALQHPKVVAIFTGKDISDLGPVPCGISLPDLRIPHHHLLAQERVYYVGHPIAVVVANDKYAARDAVDLIEIDFEPGPSVSDPEEALDKSATPVHPEYKNNVAFTHHQEGGDVDAAFAEADVVVKERIISQRLIPSPLEPRGTVATWNSGDKTLTVYSSTQIPHILRSLLSSVLNLPEHKLRVVAPEVGGGFGCKCELYPEEALTGFIAMQLGKPVKWIATRREDFLATIHGRGHVDYYELAAKRDGTMVGLKVKIVQDIGAFHMLLTPVMPVLSVLMLPGLYRFKNVQADVIGAFTNRMATDLYRGAGRPEATHGIERMVEILAAELQMDPAEIRMKNFVPASDFPYDTPTGLSYDSGNYAALLEKTLELADYNQLRHKQKEARKEGRLMGIGLCTYGEICGFGPSPTLPTGGWESATVKIEPSGHVTVMSGISSHGQGAETSFSQITADELGIDIDDIVVLHGDTATVQHGVGTFGSRNTVVGGTALVLALQELKEKIERYGAMLLDSDDVTYSDGGCTCNKTGKTVELSEISGASYNANTLPPNTQPGLVCTNYWEPPNYAFPFGAHLIVSEVDRDTGEIEIKKYLAVDDCGKIINPLMVEGQVHGGVAQGLGQALYEQVVYDETGQLVTGEYMDYAVPKASMIPHIQTDRTETPSPVNPLGVKGIGEAGTIAASPAMVNSVVDALSPLGVRHIDMPLTPEKVWKLVQEGGK